jgi:hypothetical protein
MTVTRTKAGGGLQTLSKQLHKLDEIAADMEVGIFGERRHRGRAGAGPKLAQLLAWHEFGTKTIPARRPVRRYFEGPGPAEIAERTKAVLPAVLRGEADVLDAAKAIGGVAVAGVRKGIMARLPPPLAASTQANPARDQRMIPLYDTGQLYGALAVKIDGKVHRV